MAGTHCKATRNTILVVPRKSPKFSSHSISKLFWMLVKYRIWGKTIPRVRQKTPVCWFKKWPHFLHQLTDLEIKAGRTFSKQRTKLIGDFGKLVLYLILHFQLIFVCKVYFLPLAWTRYSCSTSNLFFPPGSTRIPGNALESPPPSLPNFLCCLKREATAKGDSLIPH